MAAQTSVEISELHPNLSHPVSYNNVRHEWDFLSFF